ncbi:MAG TPA: S8 family serine peptidase [Gemmatimonadaceae bacterium]|nr:S8 family serine peptidase [Gemmatimonadaceae bacterium]
MQLRKSFLALSLIALGACSSDLIVTPDAAGPSFSVAGGGTGRFVVTFRDEAIPADFADRVGALGGTVDLTSATAGFAAVGGLTADAAATLGGSGDVLAVEPDAVVTLDAPIAAEATEFAPEASVEALPNKALAYGLQWTYKRIGADVAWKAGRVGSSNVRVAILDTGIDDTHWDLRGLVDTAASASFVPGDAALMQQFFGRTTQPWRDMNGHGTHVASTVSSNAVYFAGVTQKTTLIAVKVLGAAGSNEGSSVMAGIVHAVDKGADVINMSLGGGFLKAGGGAPALLNRVTSYARRAGVTIVVAAGNDELDLSHIGRDFGGKYASYYANWCDNPNVICVSSVGPKAAPTAATPAAEYDLFASYSNYGRAIDFAAPGGNISYRTNPDGSLALDKNGNPVVAGVSFVIQACSRWSLNYNKTTKAYSLSICAARPNSVFTSGQVGTSQATPHVTGLAALLVEQYGRSPAAIRAAIAAGADDLGKPGADPYYGKGRINVARALGL